MDRCRSKYLILGRIMLSGLICATLLQAAAYAQSPTPVISQLLPDSRRAGSPGVTLNVLGAQFVSGAVVRWNGADRVTTFFSSGLLEVAILTEDLATPGSIAVTVVNPGVVISNVAIFTVTNPIPEITVLSPASAVAGGPELTLTVSGQGFTAESVVMWNGSAKATTFVDSNTLRTVIPAADIAEAGVVSVNVVDTAPGGASSASLPFTIVEAALFFPQVVVGGAYNTVFTVLNTGTGAAIGNLTLTDQQGNPFIVNASSIPPVAGSIIPFSIPPGGVRIFRLTAVNPGDPVKAGWARINSDVNTLTGVATFQTAQGNVLTSMAGVLPALMSNLATIPVDNEAASGRRTGFAVANPGNTAMNISILILDENGVQTGTVSPAELNPLLPHSQAARFLDQYAPQTATFKGSMILFCQNPSDLFVSVALILSQGLTGEGVMSVVPVITGPVIQ